MALVVVGSIAGVGLAQSGVPQLGLTEQAGRRHVHELVSNWAGGTWLEEATFIGASVIQPTLRAAVAAHAKLPAAARGPATSALYSWARSYTGSPAFKTEYEKMRQARKPEPRIYERTVEEEVKAKLAEQEETVQNLSKLSGQSKEQLDALRKQIAGTAPLLRQQIESERAKQKADDDSSMKAWEAATPADPNQIIVRVLRRFLETTEDVDFAAKGQREKAPAGEYVNFENDAYEKRPWQWQYAWEVGPEVTAAARTAAAEWVKTLGR
jgi:hypothetical protein